jgi:hypothetical protein
MRVKGFTPATLAIWLRADPEHVESIALLLESGDLKLVDFPGGGLTVLRTHSRDLTRFEIGSAPILPPATD